MNSNYASLTAKQKKVYLAIEKYIKVKNIPPTVREIGEMVGEKTPGAVQGILNRLEQKGVIKREVGMARSIRLTMSNPLYSEPIYIPEIKKITPRNVDDLYSVYNLKRYIPLPSSLNQSANNLFVIECTDQGLAKRGVNYGDLLIVEQGSPINDGDIVIIMYGNYTLLRQYYSNPDSSILTLKTDLDPFNKEIFKQSEITIIGKVIGSYHDFN